jgi:parvulin-like peptidyl-prolyl isomerase
VPKRRRRTHVPAPTWGPERGAIGRRLLGRSPQFYTTAAVIGLTVIAVAVLAFGFGSNWLEDRNRPNSTAVQIADTKYSVRYFTDRMKDYIAGAGSISEQFTQNPQLALQPVSSVLIEEAVLREFAPEQEQSVNDEEIKAHMATLLGLPAATDPNFDAKLQEKLTATGFTSEQFRDTAISGALKDKLRAKFRAQVPTTAEAIHYRQIILDDQAAADAALKQVNDGADFAAVAKERSTDQVSAETGGDLGWVPRGVLDKTLEDTLFALEPGQLTTYPTQQNVFVYQVVEKQPDRAVEGIHIDQITANNLQKWIDEKRASLEAEGRIKNHMEFPGGDLDKIQYALSRIQPTTS